LHGHLGTAPADAGAFEVNGGKRRLRDDHRNASRLREDCEILQGPA
jgi:hypothetical protein